MNKGIAVVMLVVGIVLIIWGISVAKSFSSDISRFFTGSPTSKAIWILVAGIVTSIIGLLLMMAG